MKTRRAARKGTRRQAKSSGYFTHANGARPFFVSTKNGVITVSERGDGEKYDKEVLRVPRYEKLMVGANKGKYANKYEGEVRGNSLLIHVSGLNYIYVGDHILKFKAQDTISEFHGIMGNSDVVYAFAIGTTNTYFFSDDKYLPNTLIDMSKDPYVSYFVIASKAKSIGGSKIAWTGSLAHRGYE